MLPTLIIILLGLCANKFYAFNVPRIHSPTLSVFIKPLAMSHVSNPRNENSECKRTVKPMHKFLAQIGIIYSGLLPGRVFASQKSPTAIVAEDTKARQSPRDIWSGIQKSLASKMDEMSPYSRSNRQPPSNDIKTGTSSFVSAMNSKFTASHSL